VTSRTSSRQAALIRECRIRLKIFQQALNITADKDVGLEYLRKTYARILLGTELETPEQDQECESNEETGVKTETKN
jgi:hypothetical protein